LIDYIIPDIPTKLSDFSRRETLLTNEIILQAELNQAGLNRAAHKHLTEDQITAIKKKVASYDGTQLLIENCRVAVEECDSRV